MFEDKYRAANEAMHPSAEAEERVLAAMHSINESESGARSAAHSGGRRISRGLTAAIAAALCVLFVAPAIIGITGLARRRINKNTPVVPEDGRRVLALSVPVDEAASAEDDYSAVFARFKNNLVPYSKLNYSGGFFCGLIDVLDVDFVKGRGLPESALADADYKNEAPSAAEPDGKALGSQYGSEDYSRTNTQVEGVDEADVVKTDGRYIYVLNEKGVTVLTAEGKDSEEVSFISVKDIPKHHEYAQYSFAEMYLLDGKLVIIANEFVYSELLYDLPEGYDEDSDDCLCYGGMFNRGSSLTSVYVYDTADPAEPRLVSSLCQDGWYNTSRVTGGRLYVVTNYAPNICIFEDMPCTFVPCTYDANGACRLTPAADIKISGESEDPGYESYTYVSSLDVASPADFTGTLAIMGSSGTVYCSSNNLYIAAYDSKYENTPVRFDVDPNTNKPVISENGSMSGVYVSGGDVTKIYRVAIGGAKPELAATGEVEGYLLNQFSMDEYNGCLRIVTDRDRYDYIEQKEDNYSYNSYYMDQKSDNALYVLDSVMNVVGTVEDLGKNEHVKSVRFMGDTGYVVTFRQTDPLYAIDLSSPTEPRVLSELKIPGFSEYMHPWGEGMLLGFGQQADIETGGAQGVKLSMFDITDKADVKELYCTHLKDVDYSSAEYNHKAILVSAGRGIIGFPGDDGKYLLYTFEEGSGFTRKAVVELENEDAVWNAAWDMRGLYVGDCFYVIERGSGVMFVIDLNSFILVDRVSFGQE